MRRPASGLSRVAGVILDGRSRLVESRSSKPAMQLSSSAQSSAADRPSGRPGRATRRRRSCRSAKRRRRSAFRPVRLHSAAGWRIEPPVSVPVAAGARRAATAAAEPPDEPPGTRSIPTDWHRTESRRFRSTNPWRTRPCWSCRARPHRPARSGDHRRIVGTDEVASIFEPQVVASPRRRKCPSGRSGCRSADRPSPRASAVVGSAGLRQARSGSTVMKALSSGSGARCDRGRFVSVRRWKSASAGQGLRQMSVRLLLDHSITFGTR
jgi:hypothetical protein